jgi:hypothetical protein
MFIFDDPTDFDPLEQIENRANPPATSVGMPLALVALTGGFGLAFGGAVAGGALAALPAYALVKKMSKVWKNNVFLRRNPGCFAHLIRSDRDMIQWIESHGKDDVAAQLLLAMKQGQKLSTCAKRTAKSLIQPEALPHKSVKAFLSAEPPTTIDSSNSKSTQPASGQAETSTGQAIQSTGQAQEGTTQESAIGCILASPIKSRFFVGAERTGKSYLAAVATQLMRDTGIATYHINLGSYGDEDSYYWVHATRSTRGDLATMTDPKAVKLLLDDAVETINAFVTHKGSPAILVVDEVAFVGSKFGAWSKQVEVFNGLIANQITALISTGAKRGKAIYCLAPSFTAGSVEQSIKAVKDLQLVYIAIHPDRQVQWEKNRITFDNSLHDKLKSNWTIPNVPGDLKADRCCFIQGEWRPVGELPKLQPAAQKVEAGYQVVTDAAPIEPTAIQPEMSELYETIARMTIAQNSTTETPGTINPDGTKEPVLSDADRVIQWAIGKLDRKPEGLHRSTLWGQAPKSITQKITRAEFDSILNDGVIDGQFNRDGDRLFIDS